MDDAGGTYIPLRKTPFGLFTMPLYAHPPNATPMQGLDEDWFADVLYDSLDMDWDVRAGAKAIMRALGSRAKPDAYGLLNSARHIDVREEDADLITPPKVEASEGVTGEMLKAAFLKDGGDAYMREGDPADCFLIDGIVDLDAVARSLAQPAPEQGEV